MTRDRDMVDATPYDPDDPEDPQLLEKIMCGGMIKTFDRMQEKERRILEEEDPEALDTVMGSG